MLPVLPYAAEQTLTLAWDAPASNADGSPITDLAGYRIYSAEVPIETRDQAGLEQLAELPASSLQADVTVMTTALSGTLYFRATAFDTSGNESALSNEVAFPYDFVPPTTITIRPVSPR